MEKAWVENPCYDVAMPSVSDFDVDSLQRELSAHGINPTHAAKLLRAFYNSAGTIDPMTLPLGKALHRKLLGDLPLRQSEVTARHSSNDGTVKLLLSFAAGGSAETVMMPAYRADRAAGCVSSQIGCAMGCDFCASTRGGFERNLSAGEIAEQFLRIKEEAAKLGRRITSIVFMGMGEPLLNLDNVIGAIHRMAKPDMGNLGYRAITVSTVGIVPGIEKLAAADLGVHLALSLHAPDDATRARIVPPAKRWPIEQIMDAAKMFQARSNRISTIEYCLLADVNDSDDHAAELAKLMSGFRAHINLIPYNATERGISGIQYRQPSRERMNRFAQILYESKVVAHFRRTRGDDVSAACGQLRGMILNGKSASHILH
jgi:23S rRNA (adenine2503-C2)-methyltransferase